jgi:hypothetical protein
VVGEGELPGACFFFRLLFYNDARTETEDATRAEEEAGAGQGIITGSGQSAAGESERRISEVCEDGCRTAPIAGGSRSSQSPGALLSQTAGENDEDGLLGLCCKKIIRDRKGQRLIPI